MVSHVQSTPHVLNRPDTTECTYYYDTSPIKDDFSLLLLLQGSSMKSVTPWMLVVDQPWLDKMQVVALGVEKPGMTKDTRNKEEYLKLNSLEQRAADCIMVINHIRATEPRWNGKIILYGHSEGATLAAYLTPLIPKVTATVMLSGGCGMSLKDELLILNKKYGDPGIKGLFNRYRVNGYISSMIFLSQLFPESTYTCVGKGNTLKYWSTIGYYNPLYTLEKVSTPLYVAHGSEDMNCPVESAEILVNHFTALGKTNLHYQRYEGYDHSYNDQEGNNHFGTVADEAFAWLEKYL